MANPPSPVHNEPPSIPGSPQSMISDAPLSSLSSSLFLSEPSSPASHAQYDEDGSRHLIIPSLALPPNLIDSEPIGNVKLWIAGRDSQHLKAVAGELVIGNPVISSLDNWSISPHGHDVIRGSTAPLYAGESRRRRADARSLEITVIDVHGQAALQSIMHDIHNVFMNTDQLLDDSSSPTSFMPFLNSSRTTLCTCLVFLLSSPPTPFELSLIADLSPHIPVIPMLSPQYPDPAHDIVNSISSLPSLSHLRPSSIPQLRESLFYSPSTLHLLRIEAAERFVHWRNRVGAAESIRSPSTSVHFSSPSASMMAQRRGHSGTITSRRPLLVPSLDTFHTSLPPRYPLADPHPTAQTNRTHEWLWNWEAQALIADTSEDDDSKFGRATIPSETPEEIKDEDSEDDEAHAPRHSHGDPLHLTSIARLAFSLIPALASRFMPRQLPFSSSTNSNVAARRRLSSSTSRSRRLSRSKASAKTSGSPPHRPGPSVSSSSWGAFALGIGAGVAIAWIGLGLSMGWGKVGIGINTFSNRQS